MKLFLLGLLGVVLAACPFQCKKDVVLAIESKICKCCECCRCGEDCKCKGCCKG